MKSPSTPFRHTHVTEAYKVATTYWRPGPFQSPSKVAIAPLSPLSQGKNSEASKENQAPSFDVQSDVDFPRLGR
ncbi:MAG: hypothetical protein K0S08_530 [Gammaproteobacteria bacterium]|jgi:hypothetical protein|nr:hypothetical protein [Gammaproteobacteria bacterium]